MQASNVAALIIIGIFALPVIACLLRMSWEILTGDF